MLQIREEVGFTKGRIIVPGKLVTRRHVKRALLDALLAEARAPADALEMAAVK